MDGLQECLSNMFDYDEKITQYFFIFESPTWICILYHIHVYHIHLFRKTTKYHIFENGLPVHMIILFVKTI